MTIDSYLDHYCARPAMAEFQDLTILHFVERYRILVTTWSTGRRRWLSLSVHTAPLIQRVQSMSSTADRSSRFTNHSAKWMSFLEHVTSIHLHTISSLGVVKFHPHLQMTFIDWNWRVAVLTFARKRAWYNKHLCTWIGNSH